MPGLPRAVAEALRIKRPDVVISDNTAVLLVGVADSLCDALKTLSSTSRRFSLDGRSCFIFSRAASSEGEPLVLAIAEIAQHDPNGQNMEQSNALGAFLNGVDNLEDVKECVDFHLSRVNSSVSEGRIR